jgi:basic membrane lipoprotein Med (substrate-binding protein (PBP1-ABC) superfamily)
MRRRSIFCLATLLAALATPVAALDTNRTIVRIQAGLVGQTVIQAICASLHCTVLGALDVLPGETGPSSLFVVRNLPPPSLFVNYSLLGIQAVEPDLPVAVASDNSWMSNQATAAVLDQLGDCRSPTSARRPGSYLQQPATAIVG